MRYKQNDVDNYALDRHHFLSLSFPPCASLVVVAEPALQIRKEQQYKVWIGGSSHGRCVSRLGFKPLETLEDGPHLKLNLNLLQALCCECVTRYTRIVQVLLIALWAARWAFGGMRTACILSMTRPTYGTAYLSNAMPSVCRCSKVLHVLINVIRVETPLITIVTNSSSRLQDGYAV